MSNYVEMWKDLGMDLENHDNLCAYRGIREQIDIYLICICTPFPLCTYLMSERVRYGTS